MIANKNLSSNIPKSLFFNGSIQSHFHHFSDFLKSRHNSFFLSLTNKSEIQNIISSLDSNKSVGPSSIPMKIIKLLKNDISSQLTDIFNISFSPVVS